MNTNITSWLCKQEKQINIVSVYVFFIGNIKFFYLLTELLQFNNPKSWLSSQNCEILQEMFNSS